MFCTGAAPVEPGMPDSASTPTQPSSTVRATRSSQSSPAGTRMLAPPQESAPSTSTPRRTSRTTPPGKPSSDTTRLEPPPRTRTGSPAASAARTTSTSASDESVSTYRPTGPPRRRVVRPASSAVRTVSAVMRTRLRRALGGFRLGLRGRGRQRGGGTNDQQADHHGDGDREQGVAVPDLLGEEAQQRRPGEEGAVPDGRHDA